MQWGWSPGTWGGDLDLGWKSKSWDGTCCFCTAVILTANTIFVTRKCKKQAWETGEQFSSPHSLSSCCTFMRNGNWWLLSFTIQPTKPSSDLISSLLRILPQKWVYLLNRNNKNDFSLWNVLRSLMSVYENGGICFPKESAFSEDYRKLLFKGNS